MYREPTLQGFVSEATPNANPSGRPAPTCHSGEVAPATGAQESRRSNQNSFTSKSGSAQTQSGSTPSEGYSREAWIPGPLPRNDNQSGPSSDTVRDGVTPLPRNDRADGSSDQNPPIRAIRVIRGQPNAAITRPVTVGMSVTAPSAIAERDVSYVMDCVREGRFEGRDLKALLTTIRSLPKEPTALAAGMKRALPWFSGSTFHRRRGNEFFKAAWFMVFDLDHVPDIEGLKTAAIAKLPCLRYAFQSVRDGVKLVAEFASPITKEDDFRTIWKYLALRIEKALNIKVDSTPDPARACFLSYDPELLTNPSCRPLDPKKTLREAEAIADLLRITSARKVDVPVDQRPAGTCEVKGSLLRSEVNGDVNLPMPPTQPRKVDVPGGRTGATDVPVGQGPEGLSETKDKLLRSFANGDVCGSCNRGDVNLPVKSPDDYEKASKVVQKLAQMVIPYSDWYRIGLALYAGFGEAGRPIWDLFLANPHYRDTQRELDAKWNSFRGVREITLATLFEIGGRHGCQ